MFRLVLISGSSCLEYPRNFNSRLKRKEGAWGEWQRHFGAPRDGQQEGFGVKRSSFSISHVVSDALGVPVGMGDEPQIVLLVCYIVFLPSISAFWALMLCPKVPSG